MFTLFSAPFQMPLPGSPKILPLDRILGARPGRLADLCRRAAELARLTEVLRAGLASPAGDHLVVADFDATTLVILADSAAWATRLRFQVPVLLEIARNAGGLPSLQTIRVRATVPAPRAVTVSRHLRLSAESAETLRRCAESIGDTTLRESLLRLARRF